MTTPETLNPLGRLAGLWITEATHPKVPGVIVHGTAVFEWLEGARFMMQRARNDHADFPDFVTIIGHTDQDRVDGTTHAIRHTDKTPPLSAHYYDSRGVFRILNASIDNTTWKLWRDSPGFSQRFTGTLSGDDDAIDGQWELCDDDVHWAEDLKITYRRSETPPSRV